MTHDRLLPTACSTRTAPSPRAGKSDAAHGPTAHWAKLRSTVGGVVDENGSVVSMQKRVDARPQSRNVEPMCGVVLGRDAVSPYLATTDPEGENPMRAIRECLRDHGRGWPREARLDQHDVGAGRDGP